jgi:hypothetical protein
MSNQKEDAGKVRNRFPQALKDIINAARRTRDERGQPYPEHLQAAIEQMEVEQDQCLRPVPDFGRTEYLCRPLQPGEVLRPGDEYPSGNEWCRLSEEDYLEHFGGYAQYNPGWMGPFRRPLK